MLHPRFRYRAGTARVRLVESSRRLHGRARRHPPCATIVPKPHRARRGTPRLELAHALLAVDLNPAYAGLWPVAKRAWTEIAGIEPTLVLVAQRGAVPPDLAADPAVHVFEPEPTLHTAFQAQCIRLLYPALLHGAGGVITSDVDMVPMSPGYFHRPLRDIDARHFVCYRDDTIPLGELPICYNAALPSTWASIFDISDLDDVREHLRRWAEGIEYEGARGSAGWTTDQRVLYRILLERGRREHDVWIFDDYYTGYRRLERAYVEKWGRVPDPSRELIARRAYSDFHLLGADDGREGLNEAIVELAIASL